MPSYARVGVATYSAYPLGIRNRMVPRRIIGGGPFAYQEENKLGLFHDTTAAWKSTGEDGAESVNLPEDWETSLGTAYDADMAASGDLAGAKVAELENTVAELTAQLTAAKAANWDLIQAKPIEADSSPENSPNNIDNADENADGANESDSQGISSLFEKKD